MLLQGAGSEVEYLGFEQVAVWDAGTAGSGFTHYAPVLVPKYSWSRKLCVSSFKKRFIYFLLGNMQRDIQRKYTDIQRVGETERKIFTAGAELSRSQGAWSLFGVSPSGAGTQGFWHPRLPSQATSRELDRKQGSQD